MPSGVYPHKSRPVAERFWKLVDKSGECWLWRGVCHKKGYGQFKFNGRHVHAHRVSYMLEVGPIPPEMVIDHLCRVRQCVRPDHLEVVSNRENILRGEGIAARRKAQTHCIHGHPFDEVNTYHYRGFRYCRACTRTRKPQPRPAVVLTLLS